MTSRRHDRAWAIAVYAVLAIVAAVTNTPFDDVAVAWLLPALGMIQGPPDAQKLIRAMPESVYRVMREIPELGAREGDFIVIMPKDREAPCVLHRRLPLDEAIRHLGDVAAPLIYAATPLQTPEFVAGLLRAAGASQPDEPTPPHGEPVAGPLRLLL